MAYITVEELRKAGITEEQASRDRLEALILRAMSLIELHTGQWFEPRQRVYTLDGNGRKSVDLPVPVADPDTLMVWVDGQLLMPGSFSVCSQGEDRWDPYLWRAEGWPRGHRNIRVQGMFGFVEDNGKTPEPIKHACAMYVQLLLKHPDERRRVSQEGAEGAQVTYERDSRFAGYSGDPEIDSILAAYRRPIAVGAV